MQSGPTIPNMSRSSYNRAMDWIVRSIYGDLETAL